MKTPTYFIWRNGRPRWEPGPTLRAKGARGCDLKDESGNWLSLGAAIDAAQKLNDGLPSVKPRNIGSPSVKPRKERAADLTLHRLMMRNCAGDGELPRHGEYIYVFGFAQWVKIGFTECPAARYQQVAQGIPEPLIVHLVARGTRKDEARFHRIFAAHRTRGEWFRNSGELTIWLARLAAREEQKATQSRTIV